MLSGFSQALLKIAIYATLICVFLTFYLFFSNSEYFLKSLLLTLAIPALSILAVMFLGPTTRFLITNILIIPALGMTAYFVDIKAAIILWLVAEMVVFLTRKAAIHELKISPTPPGWIYSNYREVFVFHGLVSATFVGCLYYLGYVNGAFGHASKLISAVGEDGIVWLLARFSLWGLFVLFLLAGFVFLMGVLREILEALTLNHKVDDILNNNDT